jgi:hypothetical protein
VSNWETVDIVCYKRCEAGKERVVLPGLLYSCMNDHEVRYGSYPEKCHTTECTSGTAGISCHPKKNEGHSKKNEGNLKKNEGIDQTCSNSANVHQSQSQEDTPHSQPALLN